MQYVKKYFSEGLIQLTILLSLIGVRVDVTLDAYLSSYFSPLLETSVGQSSAYVQTPLHNLRDTLHGYTLHPKCPDLDSYFAGQRLLSEVRALGSPRFPTRLSAWLVYLVPAGSDSADSGEARANPRDGDGDTCASGSRASRRDERDARPCPPPAACELPKEDSQPSRNMLCNRQQDAAAPADEVADVAGASSMLARLADSDALDETLLGSSLPSSSLEPQTGPRESIDPQWHDLLSLSGFDDLEMEIPLRASDLGVDVSSALSRNVSLQDAMVRGGTPGRALRQASTNSTHSDPLLGVGALPLEPFPPAENGTRNSTFHSSLSGCLDEAVFEQINLLGLGLDGLDVQPLDGRDSDSGLSSFRSPGSPSSSMVSSGESYGEDEGAAGCISEAESVNNQGAAAACWSDSELLECIQHNHTYTTPPLKSATCCQPRVLGRATQRKEIKKEVLSEEEEEEEEVELSRDERYARALHIPFSVSEIVNMPVEEFLELLACHGLTPAQVALLRDIRRRGKNKLAAQNCRKRKLDAISSLEGEVRLLGRQRDHLLRERTHHGKALGTMKQKLERLSQDLMSRLRDERGRPLSPGHYTLQCSSDGRVLILPRRHSSGQPKTEKRKNDKKH